MAGKTKEITTATFKAQVLEASKLVLVDFWAPWCGPCRMIAPTLEKIADAYDGKVVVGKVDVDENPELAKEYGVMTIPTIILFKDGILVNQTVGLTTKAALIKLIENNL